MPSRRINILWHGAKGQCPRCLCSDLFSTRFRFRESCPRCHLPIEKEDGWSLGAIPLSYGITCLGWVLPLGILLIADILALRTALILAGAGCLILPILTHRFSKCLWLGIYYAVLPHELESQGDK